MERNQNEALGFTVRKLMQTENTNWNQNVQLNMQGLLMYQHFTKTSPMKLNPNSAQFLLYNIPQ